MCPICAGRYRAAILGKVLNLMGFFESQALSKVAKLLLLWNYMLLTIFIECRWGHAPHRSFIKYNSILSS